MENTSQPPAVGVRIRILNENARPQRMTPGSAGFDLRAALPAPRIIAPGQIGRVPTGIAVGLPEGYAGFVFARSGLAVKHGVTPVNAVGVIDRDYTGEIFVGLVNLSREPYTVEPGERIAQLIVLPAPAVRLIETASLGETGRGAGGFGSTGKF